MKKRKSLRLKKYDYSEEGMYFVTICLNDRGNILGEIIDSHMQLSLMGKIADEYWNLIPKIYPNVDLDHYVIMPDHLHGIITIDVGAVINRLNQGAIDNRPYGQLSQIIKSYKQIVTKQIRKQGNVYFQWQRSFYDRIIRNESELNQIRQYINNNPLGILSAQELINIWKSLQEPLEYTHQFWNNNVLRKEHQWA